MKVHTGSVDTKTLAIPLLRMYLFSGSRYAVREMRRVNVRSSLAFLALASPDRGGTGASHMQMKDRNGACVPAPLSDWRLKRRGLMSA